MPRGGASESRKSSSTHFSETTNVCDAPDGVPDLELTLENLTLEDGNEERIRKLTAPTTTRDSATMKYSHTCSYRAHAATDIPSSYGFPGSKKAPHEHGEIPEMMLLRVP